MKKAALIAAALAMTLSLAACGNRDNNTPGSQTNGNSTTENGTTNGNNGNNDVNGANRRANTGTTNGSGTGTGTTNGRRANTGTTNGSGAGTGTNSANGRSSVGNDLRRAADDVGDAVTGLMDDGRNAVKRNTSATSFEKMLDNARVHDVDGVLTDGENSRW